MGFLKNILYVTLAAAFSFFVGCNTPFIKEQKPFSREQNSSFKATSKEDIPLLQNLIDNYKNNPFVTNPFTSIDNEPIFPKEDIVQINSKA